MGYARRGVYKNCLICNKQFYVKQSGLNQKYCSRKCMGACPENRKRISLGRTGVIPNRDYSKSKHARFWLGKKMSEEHRKKLSESHKGQIPCNKGKKTGKRPWNYYRRTTIICKECNKETTVIWKRKDAKFCCWACYDKNVKKDAMVNTYYRHNSFYKIWKDKVFERDNWTCQHCYKRGGDLEAHHIKSFTRYPELRYEILNGITLCKECHKNNHYHLKGVGNEETVTHS